MHVESRLLPRSLLVLALLGGAAACQRSEAASTSAAKGEAVIHAATAPIAEKPMAEFLTLTGTLAANQESDVAANTMGKVTAVYVERGQLVKQGDLLATLDARTATLSANAMEAQASLARTQLTLADEECDRARKLFDTGSISKAELDRTMAQCSTTKFSSAAAEANQKSASKVVIDANIRAPFAGVVGERFVNLGQYVQASTRVASVYAIDPLRLELTVPEASVGLIRTGMVVEFAVSAFDKETFTGTVRFISPNVRRNSRDLVVEALVPNPGKLRPGMFATAHLALRERLVPVVPLTALKKEDGRARLFVVVGGRVNERMVQIGEEKDGVASILMGAKTGEAVIVQPGADVRDGARVE